MIEKELDNEIMAGFKEISNYSDAFRDDDSKRFSFSIDSIIGLILGIGLFVGLIWGISNLLKK